MYVHPDCVSLFVTVNVVLPVAVSVGATGVAGGSVTDTGVDVAVPVFVAITRTLYVVLGTAGILALPPVNVTGGLSTPLVVTT